MALIDLMMTELFEVASRHKDSHLNSVKEIGEYAQNYFNELEEGFIKDLK